MELKAIINIQRLRPTIHFIWMSPDVVCVFGHIFFCKACHACIHFKWIVKLASMVTCHIPISVVCLCDRKSISSLWVCWLRIMRVRYNFFDHVFEVFAHTLRLMVSYFLLLVHTCFFQCLQNVGPGYLHVSECVGLRWDCAACQAVLTHSWINFRQLYFHQGAKFFWKFC